MLDLCLNFLVSVILDLTRCCLIFLTPWAAQGLILKPRATIAQKQRQYLLNILNHMNVLQECPPPTHMKHSQWHEISTPPQMIDQLSTMVREIIVVEIWALEFLTLAPQDDSGCTVCQFYHMDFVWQTMNLVHWNKLTIFTKTQRFLSVKCDLEPCCRKTS